MWIDLQPRYVSGRLILLEMEREKLVSSNDFVGSYVHNIEIEYGVFIDPIGK